jgi:HprK-related kinase A
MLVRDVGQQELLNRLAGNGLFVRFGPFNIRIRSDVSDFAPVAHALYRPYPLLPEESLVDFHVAVARRKGLRRWVHRQVVFSVDGRRTFAPYALSHAFPALEWGLNWCIATRAHHLLMLHCAVVERDGQAILFPAWPGHGKSTLCTALAFSGWRLLSDEFGLVRPQDGMMLPIPRLIPLKNESIGVIARFRPKAVMGPSFFGTRKGTVAHVIPPEESIRRGEEPAKPRWLIFPRWVAGAPLALEPIPKSQAFLMVATNAFNYEVLDETAFRLVTEMVKVCDCYSLLYSDINQAVTAIGALTDSNHG